MEKNIGIDIDGVITAEGDDQNNIWQKELSKYVGYNLKRKKDAFDFREAYDLPEKTINNFINNKIEQIYRNAKPAPYVKNVLNNLKKNNFTLFIITARKDKYKDLTSNWLKKYNIPYDFLYHQEDKAAIALNKNIEIFAEDNLENAISLIKNQIPVIIMDRYHNRSINENKYVFRVNNWKQLEQVILDYFNELH